MLTSKKVSEFQFQKNLKETGAFVAFISTLAVCIWFFVTLKTYHAHLEKADQLDAILKNPNARVAAGKKGKKVVKKLQAKNTELKAEKVAASDENSIEALIVAAKAKKNNQAVTQALLSNYQAPQLIERPHLQAAQPSYNYSLIEPVAAPVRQQPVQQQQYWYPNFEVSAPIPVPQPVMQRTAVRVEPAKEQLNLSAIPKQQLIKALLAQLAKDDLEQ